MAIGSGHREDMEQVQPDRHKSFGKIADQAAGDAPGRRGRIGTIE